MLQIRLFCWNSSGQVKGASLTSSVPLAAALSIFGFAATCASVPVLKRMAFQCGLVSEPGGRRNHPEVTPLVGGLAIYPAFAVVFVSFLALLGLGWIAVDRPSTGKMVSLFAATTFLLIVGTLDDRNCIGWRKKLFGQFLGTAILVVGGHTVETATLPFIGLVDFGWFGIPLFIFAVILVTNAINLVDGMDGLAGGICLFAALTYSILGILKGDLFAACIGFTITGSLIGFLLFNFPPASIFLGDGGSMMLGFLLGTLATSSVATQPGQRFGTAFMILVPFLPFGIPLFEVALSVLRRWIRGQAIFLGDENHLHHRLIDKIKNPRLTIGVFYFFSAALCGLTLFLEMEISSMALRFMGGVAAVLLLAGAVGSLRLYRVDKLYATFHNRRHFKFLGTFLSYVKNRLARAKSLHELIDILQIGVRDLGFDYIEVAREGKVLQKWVNGRPAHPESSRIVSEETFSEGALSVSWARPVHDDETYNEYLMLTWHRFMQAFRAELEKHAWELDRPARNNVLELPRKVPVD